MAQARCDDPYALLGIPVEAGPREIITAYRRRVRQLHPDAPGGDEKLLRAVVAAYQLLRDPARRAEHDRHHNQHTQRQAQPSSTGTAVPLRNRRHDPPQPLAREPDLRAGPVRYHPR